MSELPLPITILGAQPKHGNAKREIVIKTIAKTLSLWRRPVRTGNVIPARRIGDPGPARPRINEDNGITLEFTQDDRAAVGRL